ncbi:hypothetical protein GEV33_015210 [Tenebrio molitor]|nr:hypothetical protein GEV33_015210 [Tenebrio molitor]
MRRFPALCCEAHSELTFIMQQNLCEQVALKKPSNGEHLFPKCTLCGTSTAPCTLQRKPYAKPVVLTATRKIVLTGNRNFASPGVDGIATFWWKSFSSIHGVVAERLMVNEIRNRLSSYPSVVGGRQNGSHPENRRFVQPIRSTTCPWPGWITRRLLTTFTTRSFYIFGKSDRLPTDSAMYRAVNLALGTKVKIRYDATFRLISLVPLRKGVFQGDSLSPLLSLYIGLRNAKGYLVDPLNRRNIKFTHLFYMDDLKLYLCDEKELRTALGTDSKYCQTAGVAFTLDKCAVVRVFQLSAKNKIVATNVLAVPLLSYSFGIDELKYLDREPGN